MKRVVTQREGEAGGTGLCHGHRGVCSGDGDGVSLQFFSSAVRCELACLFSLS